MPPRARKSLPDRFVRTLVGSAHSIFYAGAFGVALVSGAALHARLPPVRRLAASEVSRALSQLFRGTITIDRITGFSATGIEGIDATVLDPEGRRVLVVTGLRAEAALFPLLVSVLAETGPLELTVSATRIEHAEVTLLPGDGKPFSLVEAFTPRKPPAPSGTPAREVRVWFPGIELETACAHGEALGAARLDMDVTKVVASLFTGTGKTVIDTKRFSLGLRGLLPEEAKGTARFHLENPAPGSDGHVTAFGGFAGFVGDVQASAHGSMDGSKVNLAAEVPGASPEALRALVPGLPIFETVSVRAKAKGTWPEIGTSAVLTVGAAEIEADGAASFSGDPEVQLFFLGRNVDLRSFVESAPESHLTLDGQVSVAKAPGRAPAGDFELNVSPTTLGDIALPLATFRGHYDGSNVTATLATEKSGTQLSAKFEIHPGVGEGAAPVATFDANASIASLARVLPFPGAKEGSARLHAHGGLTRGSLDLRVDANVDRLALPSFAVGTGQIAAHVTGPVRAPRALSVDASISAVAVRVGPLSFDHAEASAKGALGAPHVSASFDGQGMPSVTTAASFSVEPGASSLHDITIGITKDKTNLQGTVKSIRVADGALEVNEAELLGAGGPMRGSLRLAEGDFDVSAHAADLDLDTLRNTLGVGGPILGGHASFDAEIHAKGGGKDSGHVRVQVRDGKAPGITGIAFDGEATLDGRALSAGAHVEVANMAQATVAVSSAKLAGSPFALASYRNATGKLRLDGSVDMTPVGKFAPLLGVPGTVAGTLQTQLVVTRDQMGDLPAYNGLVWTSDLEVKGADHFHVKGLDVQVGATLEGGRAEEQHAEVNARIVDDEGVFATLTLLSEVPVAKIEDGSAKMMELLSRLPLTAHIALPRRKLARYPVAFRPSALGGEMELSADVTGTLVAPVLSMKGSAHALAATDARLALPVDAELMATYDAEKAAIKITAARPDGKVLDVTSTVDLKLADLLARPKDKPLPWSAAGQADIAGFPLASVPLISDQAIDGKLSGHLRFSGLHADPKLHAELEVDGGKVGAAPFSRALVRVDVEKELVAASATLEAADGHASASGSAAVHWGSELVPVLDREKPLDAYLDAKNFQAATLLPFLGSIFTHLEGHIDATGHFHQEWAKDQVVASVDGSADLSDGVFQIPEIGQEFRGAHAHLSATSDGRIALSDLSANGVIGRMTGSGVIQFRGLAFEGAEGSIRIAEKEEVPLTLEGVPLGNAWGALDVEAKKEPGKNAVTLDIQVPTLHVDLPQSSARDVQSLADNPKVEIGRVDDKRTWKPILLSPPEEARTEDAMALHAAFHLGRDVRVRGANSLEVVMTGDPVVDITDKARVSGQIDLRSGQLDINGKRFQIERGTATLDPEEAGNPELVVRARWDAPDGSRIYADFAGPLRTGKLTLSSEPARSQSDILALLLFGASTTSDVAGLSSSTISTGAAQEQNAASGASGIVGNQATAELNRVLSDVSPVDITTRVDTSIAQNPAPEVAVQISRDLSAEVSYRTGLPAPGQTTDRVRVTIDWRFRRNWSLSTTVGDQGSSVLDLAWQYRY